MFFDAVTQVIGRSSMLSAAVEGIRKDQPFARSAETLAHFFAGFDFALVKAAGLFLGLYRNARHARMTLPSIARDSEQQSRSSQFISTTRQLAEPDQTAKYQQQKAKEDRSEERRVGNDDQ